MTSERLQYYLSERMTWFVRCDVRPYTVLSILKYELAFQMWRQSIYSTVYSNIWPWISDVTSERLQYYLI